MATHSSILACRIPRTESLAGYSAKNHKESDMTDKAHIHTLGLFDGFSESPGFRGPYHRSIDSEAPAREKVPSTWSICFILY